MLIDDYLDKLAVTIPGLFKGVNPRLLKVPASGHAQTMLNFTKQMASRVPKDMSQYRRNLIGSGSFNKKLVPSTKPPLI